ncbi:MAG: PH domain-containing protein [Thermoplasmata archaeon]
MAVSRPLPRMVHVWALKVLLIPILFWIPALYSVLVPLLNDPQAGFLLQYLLLLLFLGVGIVAASYGWALLYWKMYRWRQGEEELHVWRGIIFRKRIAIPYTRVQNVNVVRGPFLLLYGLSGVEVETAGQAYSSLINRTEGYLPGIVKGEALADSILERVRRGKAEGGL